MAGSWRNPSSSLVGFKRLAGIEKPTVAKKRGTLMGQSFGGGSVTWGTSIVALEGPRRRVSQNFCPRGRRDVWSVMLCHSKALFGSAFLGLSWPRDFTEVLLVSQQYYINF